MEQTTEKKPTTKVVEQPKPVTKNDNTSQPESPNTTAGTITHKGFPADSIVQQYVQYAYSIWGMDLVTLIECENWSWNPHRKASWKEDSWWFCMINRRWHKDIVDNDLFRSDWEWQINKCKELRAGWTKFYAPDRKIKGVKCSNYVKSRFIFE